MDLHQAMRTTFACREWTDDPVDDATIHRILDHARFAPSGGNRQGQRVIVVRDPATRSHLVELIGPATAIYAAQVAAGEAPWNTVHPSSVDEARWRADPEPNGFPGRDALARAPVVLVVTLDLSVTASFDRHLDRIGVISGASIYPFVWNVLLAATAEGLGGVLTTYLADQEPQVQALLGIPPHHAVAAAVPLGRPRRRLTRLRRRPVESFAARERFDGAPFELR